MTKCSKCKLKIIGRTSYNKCKPVCQECWNIDKWDRKVAESERRRIRRMWLDKEFEEKKKKEKKVVTIK